MAELGKYLYCLIRCREERTFNAVAMGSEDSVVHTICQGDLAIVVSDSLLKQYESSRSNMMAHEKVLETVMREFALLPVRFGTVTDSTSPREDIHKLLSSKFEEFNRLLRDIEGKVELGLKAFWRDEQAVFEEIVAENADIRRLRNKLSGRPPQAIHFEGMQLGRMVKEALDQKRRQEAARILHPLRPIAHSVRENNTLVDRVIVNAAFLVDKVREPEFDQAVSRLDEQIGERIALKYIGPVPPYNFVSVVVNWEELR
ncbi:MAG: GvpL/GvpF family gas vesicle protein [Chloroflexi bacterium]|nr:GvpL/GvpF family gas vesicle protein [Chloroflexota bacterium]MCL5075486.1 GvpL/GvpF family gas vesicle protein [Chloroflexota bacterium]